MVWGFHQGPGIRSFGKALWWCASGRQQQWLMLTCHILGSTGNHAGSGRPSTCLPKLLCGPLQGCIQCYLF